MKKRMWALATTSVLAGWASAQTPSNLPATNVPAPATGKDAAQEAGIVLLRTANQPDRKVKVIKSTKQADGRILTEVVDIKTGETLLVADKAPGGKSDTVAPATTPVPAAKATTPAPATPAVTMPTVDTMPSIDKKPMPDLPVAKPRDVDPLLNGAKTKSAPASKPTMTTKAAPPVAVAATPAPAPSPAKPMVIPTTVAGKATPTMPPATVSVRDNAPIHVTLPVGYVPAEIRMKEETAHDIATLQSASRPSMRQDAATALAEGRYGSRMEVKAILAGAAMHDPAPIVRAHCIESLSKLGYNSPEYVGYLRQCTADASSDVKTAASEALTKLEPKR
ncbi:MAG: HEAT repeat domain-containing protein [Gemmataceae bacterium]